MEENDRTKESGRAYSSVTTFSSSSFSSILLLSLYLDLSTGPSVGPARPKGGLGGGGGGTGPDSWGFCNSDLFINLKSKYDE